MKSCLRSWLRSNALQGSWLSFLYEVEEMTMALVEDDVQSCYFDANSMASESSDESDDLPLPGVWPRDWPEGSMKSAQSPSHRMHTRQSSRLQEVENHEVTKGKSHARDESVPSVRDYTRLSETPIALELTEKDPDETSPHDSSTKGIAPWVLALPRPSTSGGECTIARGDAIIMAEFQPRTRQTRSKTASSQLSQADESAAARLERLRDREYINEAGGGRDEDLFLELANDPTVVGESVRPSSHGEHTSAFSFSSKRRSLPAESGLPSPSQRRPKSSGHILGGRATARLGNSLDLQRLSEHPPNLPSHTSAQPDDVVSVSSRPLSGVPRRYVAVPDRVSSLAEQLRSPELPQYGRRRPSFGASPRQGPKARSSQTASQLQHSHYESPAEGSEPKRSLPDSASVDSETADTVWDELDDLKSRIKKLELTGKLPQTSGAAMTTEQNERPRTATTAPTTIDSSPKHETVEKQEKATIAEPELTSPELPNEYVVGGPDAANIHPNLHGALAKAKGLLNPSLYRSLEATATDALQLAVMTGSAGPQGTALTAAAIINGVTVSDRHVRRKADTMCRNLTDLVLALCEGKIEVPSMASSPITINPAAQNSPTLRYARHSLSPNGASTRSTARPMSRLEARRTSMLGSQAGSILGTSPLESGEDFSASEQESTKSYPRIQGPRDFSSRATSRLQAARQRRYDGTEEDDDPTLRPPSRAMTDIGRAKSFTTTKEYSTPQRSPSLRESLVARRVNAAAHESNRELSRVASLSSDSNRRRFLDPSTPPVVEEEGNGEDHRSSSQQRRRITSYGAYGARRAASNVQNRAASLHQSRSVNAE